MKEAMTRVEILQRAYDRASAVEDEAYEKLADAEASLTLATGKSASLEWKLREAKRKETEGEK